MASLQIHIAPTLRTMADVYALTREGGPKSPRFAKYVSLSSANWGLAPYNPMAGDAAVESVNVLIALDAETLAQNAATQVASACDYHDAITLAISVRSKGLWTDRIATEVDERVTGKRRVPHHGIVSIWSREENSAHDVVRETIAETVRTMWHAQHGLADTLNRVLACEGLAYALAEHFDGPGPYSQENSPEETVAVIEACDVLGDTTQVGDIAGVIYGDDGATAMGWTPLGIPKHAGYRWTVARARRHVADVGAARALKLGVLP